MVLTYWDGDSIDFESKAEPVYCKTDNCSYRATHADTQCCGFHHKFTGEMLVIEKKPYKCATNASHGTTGIIYGPHPKDFNQRQPSWLMKMK